MHNLKFEKLEERIVLDAALAAAVVVTKNSSAQSGGDSSGNNTAAAPATSGNTNTSSPDASWPVVGQDYQNTGTNEAEHTISQKNADNLTRAWNLDLLGTAAGTAIQGQPAFADGILYAGTAGGAVLAIDASTGQLLHSLQLNDSFVTTPAITATHIYIAGDNIYAINRSDFSVSWVGEVNPSTETGYAGDPTVVGNMVIVGASSLENAGFAPPGTTDFTSRGRVVAFNADTGQELWSFYTTSDQTVPNPQFGAGAGVWSSPAVDLQRHTIYIGVGQGYEPNPSPYTDSLLAIDYQTGHLLWSKQFTAGDYWAFIYPVGADPNSHDWDVNTHPNLFSVKVDGKTLDLVGVGDKSGKYYIMERDQDPNNIKILKTIELDPGSTFGGFQSTPAYDNGVLYLATHAVDAAFTGTGQRESLDTVLNQGIAGIVQASTKIVAVDVKDLLKGKSLAQSTLWTQIRSGPTTGPLTLANGVLYHTSMLGTVEAMDIKTGKTLWQDIVLPDPLGIGLNLPLMGGVTIANGHLYVPYGIYDATSAPFPFGGIVSYDLTDTNPGNHGNGNNGNGNGNQLFANTSFYSQALLNQLPKFSDLDEKDLKLK